VNHAFSRGDVQMIGGLVSRGWQPTPEQQANIERGLAEIIEGGAGRTRLKAISLLAKLQFQAAKISLDAEAVELARERLAIDRERLSLDRQRVALEADRLKISQAQEARAATQFEAKQAEAAEHEMIINSILDRMHPPQAG
jgi:hypothetical protein